VKPLLLTGDERAKLREIMETMIATLTSVMSTSFIK
jgi:hypothetical protein